jgi:type II secretory pathway component PulF
MTPVRRHAKSKGAAESTKRYRAKLRAQGLRPVQIWVPDTRSPKFAAECRRQSLLIASNAREDGLMDALEALAAETPGWKA